MNIQDWLEYRFLDNSLLTWLISVGVCVVAAAVLLTVHRMISGRLKSLADDRGGTAVQIARPVVAGTKRWFLLLAALLIASRLLDWTPQTEFLILRVTVLGLLLQMGLWVSAALTAFLELKRRQQLAHDPRSVAAMDVLALVLQAALWSLILLVALDNFGVDVTAMIAGLGIGGIAVALAAQNVLGDLLASLAIVLDKPFVVGDFLAVDDYSGSVEHVGLKTTRLRSLSGEQLVFSNNDLLSSRIRNYGRMFERRVVFSIGVRYRTPAQKLKRIPQIIREAVESNDRVRFDRAHFQRYGDFALIFEAVYFVLSADYNLYMDIQQNANLTIYARFAEEGIDFAHPTQPLYAEQATEA